LTLFYLTNYKSFFLLDPKQYFTTFLVQIGNKLLHYKPKINNRWLRSWGSASPSKSFRQIWAKFG